MEARRFEFEFEPRFRPLTLAFGAGPESSYAEVLGSGEIRAKFGLVQLNTDVSNLMRIERSGDYRWWKAIGIRTSLKDRGLTFGSSTRHGVCLRFVEPVKPSPSLFGMAHPGLTLTLKDPDAFIEAIESSGWAPKRVSS